MVKESLLDSSVALGYDLEDKGSVVYCSISGKTDRQRTGKRSKMQERDLAGTFKGCTCHIADGEKHLVTGHDVTYGFGGS